MRKYFINLARNQNKQGLALRRMGMIPDAFVCFVMRDIFMKRARGF